MGEGFRSSPLLRFSLRGASLYISIFGLVGLVWYVLASWEVAHLVGYFMMMLAGLVLLLGAALWASKSSPVRVELVAEGMKVAFRGGEERTVLWDEFGSWKIGGPFGLSRFHVKGEPQPWFADVPKDALRALRTAVRKHGLHLRPTIEQLEDE